MTRSFSQILKNFSYTLLANVVSVLISSVVILLLPKAMGVTQYGYWQLYLLYLNYISFFHFGLADGYYLRHSGKDYADLDRPQFAFMFWLLSAAMACLAALTLLGTSLFSSDLHLPFSHRQVICMIGLACLLVIPRVFVQFAWQASNRFKLNAWIIILERAFFLAFVAFFLLRRDSQAEHLIYFDLIGKGLALILTLWAARDLVFTKPCAWRSGLLENGRNIASGLNLMLASLSSSLIIGVIQLTIERRWGIDTYSRIALTLSLSNLLMIFINALALVLLPHLKRVSEDDGKRIYRKMRCTLSLAILLLLNVYYPFRLLMQRWLPNYAEGIAYMAILFPICLFESKTQLVTNTYLKAYRRERDILKANLLAFVLCAILIFICAHLLMNLFLTVLSILVVLAFRAYISERYLARISQMRVNMDSYLELIAAAVFVIANHQVGSWAGCLIYAAFSLIYIYIRRRPLLDAYGQFRRRKRNGGSDES